MDTQETLHGNIWNTRRKTKTDNTTQNEHRQHNTKKTRKDEQHGNHQKPVVIPGACVA